MVTTTTTQVRFSAHWDFVVAGVHLTKSFLIAASDMYSMGIILNEVYSRTKPYAGEEADLKSLLIDICDRRVNKRPKMSEKIPPRMGELVKKLWSRDPSTRPPAQELDSILMDMNVQDAEPTTPDELNARPRTQDMLYELFPKHIAEALKGDYLSSIGRFEMSPFRN